MEVHRVHGGLIHDPALLQAVALGYERYDTLLALYDTHGFRPLRSGRLGRRDARRQCIALCAALCVHWSSAVHRLRLRVCPFTRTLACVTGLGSGHGAVSEPLSDHWFGPQGSYVLSKCPGLI